MNPQLEIQLKQVHANFLSIGETRALLKNMAKMSDSVMSKMLVESTLNNLNDGQIRMLCAEINGINKCIDLIQNKYESIA